MTEQELIETCKKQVEQKLGLPAGTTWKQRDFQYLSDLIFEKTATRLSISTLKRIWQNGDNRIPQVYTLNALAQLLEYKGWNEFKMSQPTDILVHTVAVDEQKIISSKIKLQYRIGILVLLVLSIVVFLFLRRPARAFNPDDIIFRSKKNMSAGVPNTVVFEYDISKLEFDSAFIQHTWDERKKAQVSKDNHFQTFIYYYPGFHSAKLTIDGEIVKREQINISTLGWEAVIDDDRPGHLPGYIPKDKIIKDGALHVSAEELTKHDLPVDDKDFFINFFNVGNLDSISAANFTLDARIRNSPAEGGLVCQYSQVTLICENGMISVPFCYPGCASTIHLHIGEILRDGKHNDLSVFGSDLSGWRNIRIKSVNNKVTVVIDEKPVYNLIYKRDLGKIAGFHFKFYGTGSVDSISLQDKNDVLIYTENFN